MRLIDRIRDPKTRVVASPDFPIDLELLVSAALRATAIDITSVRNWFHEVRSNQGPLRHEEYVCLAPFVDTAMEFSERAVGDNAIVIRTLVLWTQIKTKDGEFLGAHACFSDGGLRDGAVFCYAVGTSKASRTGELQMEGGSAVAKGQADNGDSFQEWWKGDLQTACFALTFMNCKNVTLVDGVTNKQARSFAKKYGRERAIYKVLNIEPMREVIRKAGHAHSDIRQQLHVCRGHFKDYRERPLFGKHKGLFWWDAHARGEAELGTITKDYRIILKESNV